MTKKGAATPWMKMRDQNYRTWLKGSNVIVLETVEEMLSCGERVSVRRVAARLAYSEMTVLHALQTLRSLGLITMQQSGSGHPAEYRICKTDD